MAFGNGIPGMNNAVQESARRRGMNLPSPALNQVSQGQPSAVPPVPQSAPAPQGQMPSGAPQGPSQAPINSEAEMLVKALSDRLKSISQVERGSVNTSGVGGGGIDSYARKMC